MTVKHCAGQYEVDFLALHDYSAEIPNSFVITDQNVDRLYSKSFDPLPKLVLPPGEQTKSLQFYSLGLSWLVQNGANRSSTVIAFGGGVIGDLAGFLAASYMRGVPLVQVPTSLLAQVDSSIGGKVGINLPEGKNLVGAFHQPRRVIVDTSLLATLPNREFVNGCAEVWKAASIADENLFQELEEMPLSVAEGKLQQRVRRSIEIKAAIVQADEFEQTGTRAKLNFGHTVGHAIEAIAGFGTICHGEAVSMGMVQEAWIGERLGISEAGLSARLERGLASQGLPTVAPKIPAESLLEAMQRDKKATDDKLAMSLLVRIGECKLVTGLSKKEILSMLKEARPISR